MSENLSLADLLTGPGLAAKVAGLSKRQGELDGAQLVEFIKHTQRLSDWTESLKVSATNELGYCPPSVLDQDGLRTDSRSGLVPGVLEAALGWSRGWARQYDNGAYLLVELFPATLAALAEGLVDLPSARAIAEGLAVLDDPDDRARIEASTLAWLRGYRDRGRQVNTRTVAIHVEKAVVKADPVAAKQRHKDKVRQRDVQCRPSVDSVADLASYHLPAHIATHIYNRVDAIAQALKRAGNQHGIGQLRADVAASLLLGESHYLTPDDDVEEPENEDTDTDLDDTDDSDETDSTGDAASGDSAERSDCVAPTTPAPKPTGGPMPVPADGSVPVRAKNILHISLTDLLGLHGLGKTEPAILGGFGPVIDEVVERILANHLDNPDARFDILVTHPRTGRPLQLHSVDARLFGGRRRDAVAARWPTCAWPSGCSRPAEQCIMDHSHDYTLGGKTAEVNADPLCHGHELEKTKNGWRQQREGHDLIIWISPFGDRIPVPHLDTPPQNPNHHPNRNRRPTPAMIRHLSSGNRLIRTGQSASRYARLSHPPEP